MGVPMFRQRWFCLAHHKGVNIAELQGIVPEPDAYETWAKRVARPWRTAACPLLTQWLTHTKDAETSQRLHMMGNCVPRAARRHAHTHARTHRESDRRTDQSSLRRHGAQCVCVWNHRPLLLTCQVIPAMSEFAFRRLVHGQACRPVAADLTLARSPGNERAGA